MRKGRNAMKTTHQYQFYPDIKQKLTLNPWLRICRYWYNRQLGDRFDWWEMNRTTVNGCPLIVSISAGKNQTTTHKKNNCRLLKRIW
jgi:putative transposase